MLGDQVVVVERQALEDLLRVFQLLRHQFLQGALVLAMAAQDRDGQRQKRRRQNEWCLDIHVWVSRYKSRRNSVSINHRPGVVVQVRQRVSYSPSFRRTSSAV